MSIALFKQQQK